ncbi:hypothetical protein [Burkholderia catarinensis]|uniref:hypothetical protein n=1 Tax=Burkholderia catarinensis TaxID=1108140 RepID=UPI0009106F6F|nr:hypothetical protein [Burkholderia catarinensis]KAG8150056.1 hypothetical protein BFF94_029845 [Burkholderia catarinensis]
MRHMTKVVALLLGFATLPEKSRKDFLLRMNEYLIMSPLQRRRVIREWKQVADGDQEAVGEDAIRQ